MAHTDYISEIAVWPMLRHSGLIGTMPASTHSTATITTTSSAVAFPLWLYDTETIDFFEFYAAASGGSVAGMRCRIVEASATDGLPTTTLVDANASATLAATAGAWQQFDFTNFSLAAGRYWIVLDSPTNTPTGAGIQIELMGDYRGSGGLGYFANASTRYWTGSAWGNVTASQGVGRIRLKTTNGYIWLPTGAPSLAYSGIDNLALDTLENPACRGFRFVAPYTGTIVGVDVALGNFTNNTSLRLVLASVGCAAKLAEAEFFQPTMYADTTSRPSRFSDAVAVTAGTSYDIYITPGSQATTSGGPWITAIDVSDDSGAVVECYGVPSGVLQGLAVNDPPSEGGSDTPTVSSDYVFPWVPVYGSIDTGGGGGGGGGETSHTFAA